MKALVAVGDRAEGLALCQRLASWEWDAEWVADGESAWRRFQEADFSRVVASCHLPGLDGAELTRRIRATGRRAGIVMLSAPGQEAEASEAMAAGADDWIRVPWDAAELRARLDDAGRARERDERLTRQTADLDIIRAQLAESHERLRRQTLAGARLQLDLLPAGLTRFQGIEFAWAFRPCEELAGDMLGFFSLDEQRLGFYVLDVSGHGLAPAMLSFSLHRRLSPLTATASLVKDRLDEPPGYRIVMPDETISRLDTGFPFDESTAQFFTIFYGVLDTTTRGLSYALAGHPAPMRLYRGRSTMMPAAAAPPVGVESGLRRSRLDLTLRRGERLLIFSDGAYEARRGEEAFGLARLRHALEQTAGLKLPEAVEGIATRIEEWTGMERRPSDDVSLLALEVG